MPEKLKRNTKINRIHKNKKKLGRSIEERPKEVNDRKEFGHWECDLVLGHKTKDDQVLLTLSERMSREFLIMRIPDKTADSVMAAFQSLRKQYSEHWNEIFKTITTDNGFKNIIPMFAVLPLEFFKGLHDTDRSLVRNTKN